MLLFENVYLVITVYYGKYIPTPSPLSRTRMDGDHVATDLGRIRGPCLERKEPPYGGYYYLKRPIKAGALRSLIMVRISGHETECSRTRQTKDFYSETFLIQPILRAITGFFLVAPVLLCGTTQYRKPQHGNLAYEFGLLAKWSLYLSKGRPHSRLLNYRRG